MLIERLEILDIDGNVRQILSFSPDKLNVFVEPNAYGKNLLVQSMFSCLSGKIEEIVVPSQASGLRSYLNPEMFGASGSAIILQLVGRRLRISVYPRLGDIYIEEITSAGQIIDLTDELKKRGLLSDLCRNFFGLSSTNLRNLSFLSAQDIDSTVFGSKDNLSRFLEGISQSGDLAITASQAVMVLENKINNFTFKGQTGKVFELLSGLQRGRQLLQERISQMDISRHKISNELARLKEINEAVDHINMRKGAVEYFKIKQELADLNVRLGRIENRMSRIAELKQSLKRLARYEKFPAGSHRRIEDYWVLRLARKDQENKLEMAITRASEELKVLEIQIKEQSLQLEHFTPEEAKELSGISRLLESFYAELGALKEKRSASIKALQTGAKEFETISAIRQALSRLHPLEIDRCHNIGARMQFILQKQEQLQEGLNEAEALAAEMQADEDRQIGRLRISILSCAVLLFISVCLIVLNFIARRWDMGTVLITLLFGGAFGLGLFLFNKFVSDTRLEYAMKRKKVLLNQSGLKQKISDYNKLFAQEQMSLEKLAEKSGSYAGEKLIEAVNTLTAVSSQFEEVEILDRMIESKEGQCLNIARDINRFLTQAGSTAKEVTVAEGLALADAIVNFNDMKRAREIKEHALEQLQAEHHFIAGEIKDIDVQLRDLFNKARIKSLDKIETCYEAFQEGLVMYREWESAYNELNRLERDPSFDPTMIDDAALLRKLAEQRDKISARLTLLEKANPQLAGWQMDAAEFNARGFNKEESETEIQDALDTLARERENLLVSIRAASQSKDEYYLKSIFELEVLDMEIKKLSETGTALLLARDALKSMYQDQQINWDKQLNAQAQAILTTLQPIIAELRWTPQLKLQARAPNGGSILGDQELQDDENAFLRDITNIVSRLAVAGILAKDNQLPMILDDPFGHFDDNRFHQNINLLMQLSQQHQFILLSCHQQRHQWLLQKLKPKEREHIHFCRMERPSRASIT